TDYIVKPTTKNPARVKTPRWLVIALVAGFLASCYVGNTKAADTQVSFGGAQYVQTGEAQSTDSGASINFSFSF
ncbi:hypothetical protein, partial [Herbiconiux daphne]